MTETRARWIGHELHSDVAIVVDDHLSLRQAMETARHLKAELLAHMPALRSINVTFEPSTLDQNETLNLAPERAGDQHGHPH